MSFAQLIFCSTVPMYYGILLKQYHRNDYAPVEIEEKKRKIMMNNKYTADFYKLYPEVKNQYIQLFTDLLLEVEEYYGIIKPDNEDIDFNTSLRAYVLVKFLSLHKANRVSKAIIADKEFMSFKKYRPFKRSYDNEIEAYQMASEVLFEAYEKGNTDFAYPLAILGLNYVNEFDSNKVQDAVQKIYNNTILKFVDILSKQNFENYGFLQSVAYIEYARFNANCDEKTAEHYYSAAGKNLIKLLPLSESINEIPSVLFSLASEIMFFISGKNMSPKIIKEIYTMLAYNKTLSFDDKGYFQILKLWYITQCLIVDKRYEDALEYVKELEKILSKSSTSYYPERCSTYKILSVIYDKIGDEVMSGRCQKLADNLKKIIQHDNF